MSTKVTKERIKEITEVIASILIIVLSFLTASSFVDEWRYRSNRDVRLTIGATVENEINTVDDVKKLVQDGKATVRLRFSFTNNTKYALTVRNMKIELIDSEKSNEKYYIKKTFRPNLHDREDGSTDNHVRIMTIPAGSAKEAYLFSYTRALTDEEKQQLLLIDNEEDLQKYRSGVYRIVASCIEDSFVDYKWLYRVFYDEVYNDKKNNRSNVAVLSVKYNPSYGTGQLDHQVINSCFTCSEVEAEEKDKISLVYRSVPYDKSRFEGMWSYLTEQYPNLQHADDVDSLAYMYGLRHYDEASDSEKIRDLSDYTGQNIRYAFSYELDGDLYVHEGGYENLTSRDIRKLISNEIEADPTLQRELKGVSEQKPLGINIYKTNTGKYVLTFVFN